MCLMFIALINVINNHFNFYRIKLNIEYIVYFLKSSQNILLLMINLKYFYNFI